MPLDHPEKSFTGGVSALLSTILVVALCVAAYHFFIVKPATERSAIYYVVDLPALVDAKAVSLLKSYNARNLSIYDDALIHEIEAFKDQLSNDLLELSGGYPIFQKGAVLRASEAVQDLTVVLARHYGLDLSVSVDDYLRSLQAPSPN